MKKKRLRKSEVRELLEQVKERFGKELISRKDKVEILQGEYDIILVNDNPKFFYHQEVLLPTLKLLQQEMVLKTVTVDMGAIRFVASGADIMRPGIVSMSDFPEGEFVAVIDEQNKKPLSISRALASSEEMKAMEKGKALQNIHFVGDKLWNKLD